MKSKRSLGYGLSGAQRRRMRTAGMTVVVLGCGLLLLGFWSMRENTAGMMDARDYLLIDTAQQSDPLELTDRGLGFELTGVSPDKRIVGYAGNESVELSASRLKDVLLSRGWILESDTGQGLLSFSGKDSDGGSSFGYLVQFSSLGKGCTFVIQRW